MTTESNFVLLSKTLIAGGFGGIALTVSGKLIVVHLFEYNFPLIFLL